MAITEVVKASAREGKFNKNAARRVRRAGKIPAVVYGAGLEAVAIEVDPRQINRILYSESGHNSIFDVEIEGQASTKAMIVDWQIEPLKDHLIHIDLKRIAMDKLMRVSVPVKLVGIPIGVRNFGGILDQVLREVEIECLPGDIPGHLDVDVTELALNAQLRVSDLPHAGKLTFITEENATVAHVTAIREEVVPVAEAADVVASAAEPEVAAKKGKTDEAAAKPAAKK